MKDVLMVVLTAIVVTVLIYWISIPFMISDIKSSVEKIKEIAEEINNRGV